MKIEIEPTKKTIKQKQYMVAELWTKMKTIRDDKNTPLIYAKWCSQVMKYLELLTNDE